MAEEQQKLLKMCQGLAKRFKAPNHYEDMISEGVLACLEYLQENSEASNSKLRRIAKDAMYAYLNIKTLPVHVPPTRDAVEVSRSGSKADWSHYSESTAQWMHNIIKGLPGDLTERLPDLDAHHTTDYEDREFYDTVVTICDKVLCDEEFEVFSMRYFSDMTQQEVADKLQTNKMYVSRLEERALQTLRDYLL